MIKPFDSLVEGLSAEQQTRIEQHAKMLVAEYELLKALRKDLGLSQQELASVMGIRQASLSKIENQDDMLIGTLRRYIEALGGELEITAHIAGRDVTLTQFSET